MMKSPSPQTGRHVGTADDDDDDDSLSLSLSLSFFLSASVYYEGRGGAPLMSRDRADAVAE